MLRMTGCDAQFIYDERPGEPQHTLKAIFLDAGASAACSTGTLKREIRARLAAAPPLRWRALRVPFDLHHPVWAEDPDLDLDHHVRRLGLPAPGSRRELCEVISTLAAQPLDPERPLWELWLLEGFEGERAVLVLKLSHALADGGATVELLERIFGQRPRDAGEVVHAAALPGRWQLLRSALRDRLRDALVELPRLAARSARATYRVARARLRSRGRPARPSPLRSPHTPFSGPLSDRRSFYYASVPLDEVRHVRRVFDCTVNDVVLATTAGAVRRYLLGRGALPGVATLGFMPASTRSDREHGAWGNRFTTHPIELPTQIEDPVERLRACARAAREVKRDLVLHDGAHLEDWLRWLPPWVTKLLSSLVRATVRLHRDLPGGVVVSNVRGPEPLPAPGGSIENLISVGHMKYMAGLNVTVWSYAGWLNFALYACARAVPDPWRLGDHLNESFEELRKAADRQAASVAGEDPR
jgi:diacylglycerol O-acyltransferase